jgi:2-dehydro-3-deoxyphosphooctonate aldolase (KDO 8-P synthase)
MKTVKVGAVEIGGGAPLVLIAGPCVIESETHCRMMAERLTRITQDAGVPFIFKSSYDKANRSSGSSFRGPGLKRGLRILDRIRRDLTIPVTSDIHTPEQVELAAQALDLLQIPAFLCRQTDLLIQAARSGRPLNVKKGQFLAPWDMAPLVEKLRMESAAGILLTERGSSFGYNRLVNDFRALSIMRELDCPVVFDATHSTQLPGGLGNCSGGERRYVAGLARAAVAFGCDALFVEVHDRPDEAKSDGPNSIPLDELPALIFSVRELDRIRLAQRI